MKMGWFWGDMKATALSLRLEGINNKCCRNLNFWSESKSGLVLFGLAWQHPQDFGRSLILLSSSQVMASNVPGNAAAAVLQPSEPVPMDSVSVQGPNFEKPLSLTDFLQSYERIGFQANSLGKAINIVNRMVRQNIPFVIISPCSKLRIAEVAIIRRTDPRRRDGRISRSRGPCHHSLQCLSRLHIQFDILWLA